MVFVVEYAKYLEQRENIHTQRTFFYLKPMNYPYIKASCESYHKSQRIIQNRHVITINFYPQTSY